MKSLYDAACADEIRVRVSALKPDSTRAWGKMTPAQTVAHCAKGMEMAVGDWNPPRMLLGRLLAPLIRPSLLQGDAPMRQNAPTLSGLIIRASPNFEQEQQRLLALIERFRAAGPAGCTTHPHSFFGNMTPAEWSVLMYKHLDHHLRQFGV